MLKEGNILHGENNSTYLETFAYHFLKAPQNRLYQLRTIGWQKQTSTDYYWDGMKRPDDEDQCIFQYTLSGFGCIEIGNKLYKLERNQGFLIEIPSDHKYYIPVESEKWEFYFYSSLWKRYSKRGEKFTETLWKYSKTQPRFGIYKILMEYLLECS